MFVAKMKTFVLAGLFGLIVIAVTAGMISASSTGGTTEPAPTNSAQGTSAAAEGGRYRACRRCAADRPRRRTQARRPQTT